MDKRQLPNPFYPKRHGIWNPSSSRNTQNSPPRRKMILTSTSIHEKKNNNAFNDCEIIVMEKNSSLQIYANNIKYELFKKFWLSVGLIFKSDEIGDLEALIDRIKLSGTIFVIILKSEHVNFKTMDLLLVNGLSREEEHRAVPKHLAHTVISIVSDGFIKELGRRRLNVGEIPKYEISLRRLIEQWMKNNARPTSPMTLSVRIIDRSSNSNGNNGIGHNRTVNEIVPRSCRSTTTTNSNVLQVQQNNKFRSDTPTPSTSNSTAGNMTTKNAAPAPSSLKVNHEEVMLGTSNEFAIRMEAKAIPDMSESIHSNSEEEDKEHTDTPDIDSSTSSQDDQQFFSGLSEEYETAEEEILEEGELTEEEISAENTELAGITEDQCVQEQQISPSPDKRKTDTATIRVTTLSNSGKRIVICNSGELQTGNRGKKTQKQQRSLSPLPAKKQRFEPIRPPRHVNSHHRTRDRRRGRAREWRLKQKLLRNMPAQEENYHQVPFEYEESNNASISFNNEHNYLEENEMINVNIAIPIPTAALSINQETPGEETYLRIPVHSRLTTSSRGSEPRIPVHERLGEGFSARGRSSRGEDKRRNCRRGSRDPFLPPVHERLGIDDRPVPVSARLGTSSRSLRRTPVKDRLG